MSIELKMTALLTAVFILFVLIVRGGCNAQTCMEHKNSPAVCRSEFYKP